MATLLRLETDFVSVEIQGRAGLPASLEAIGSLPRLATLNVMAGNGSVRAQVHGGADLDIGVNQPAFFEETPYWFIVESKVAGQQPVTLQRDPNVITRRDVLPAHGVATLTVIYRGQVGLSAWRFQVGDQALDIEIEVFPSKLDYEREYEALVADATEVSRALAIEYFRSTYRLGDIARSETGQLLDWVTLLRQLIDELARAVHQVNRAPYRGLHYERLMTRAHQVRGARPSVTRAIARGDGLGEFISVPGVGPTRSWLPVERANDSLDTFEHRWLRSRLRFVYGRLLPLEAEQAARIERGTARGRISERLTAEKAEIEAMTRTVAQLLDLPVIKAATSDVPAAFTSLQLQSATGYGEAYRALTALGSALSLVGAEHTYSLSDVSELYEAWCFVKVVQLIAEMTGAEIDLSAAFSTETSGLRFGLKKGSKSRVTLHWSGGSVVVGYNEQYRMPTGLQRPDIVVRDRRTGEPERVIILDAKYRIDASAEYVEQFGSPGAPTDAVNALHRYRDAIRPIVNGAREQIVAAGAALFPWAQALRPADYGLRQSLDEVGIGALAFLPGNTDDVRGWLSEMIDVMPANSE